MLSAANATILTNLTNLTSQPGINLTELLPTLPPSPYSLAQKIVIAIIASVLSVLTVVGNSMVMISFKIDKQLQTISNYFLFSLAVADFAVGLISMPLYTMFTIYGYWPLGPYVCDTWLALDYLASNASVLNLLIISFDRYFSVTRPLTYRAKRTTRRATVMIGSAWGFSLVLWPPWIYAWPYIDGERKVPPHECYIQFIETNQFITFGTAIAAFYVPVTVMCILYYRIWRETKKRQKDLPNLQGGKKHDSSKRSNSSEVPKSCTKMWTIYVLVSLALAKSTLGQASPGTPAANELLKFKQTTKNGPIGTLTTTTGRPVSIDEMSTVNTDLITSRLFMEQMSALNRENIPVRVVHGKAAGAFGYFKVTHDVSHITNAAFLSKVGKTTPVVVRLGGAFSEKGSPDTLRGPNGFAAKFYTEEGNYDFLGFTTDTFLFKDPLFFLYSVHATKRNPKTHLPDPNAIFDFLSNRPEAFNTFLQFQGDIGVPATYRNFASHSIHAFQVENDRLEISFVRFKMSPDLGVKNINQSEATRLGGLNPNILTEDLYNAIENGEYPSWTFGMQVISIKDVKKAPFDIFDVTFRWPEDKYPVKPIGKFVLNKNPENHFRDIEQLAFNPGNLVPGIEGIDKLWEGRLFAYRDAALHRMGVNANNIKVNCPMNQVFTYTRDGQAPVRGTFDGMPNYYPNSFNGPVPANVTRSRTKRVKVHTDPSWTNAGQIADYYNGLPKDSRQRLVENLSNNLSLTYPATQEKILSILGRIDAGLKSDIERGVAKAIAARNRN